MKRQHLLVILGLFFAGQGLAKNGIYLNLQTGYSQQYGWPNTSHQATYRYSVGYNHDLIPWLGIGFEVGTSVLPTASSQPPFPTLSANTLEFAWSSQLHVSCWDIMARVGGLRHTLIPNWGGHTQTKTKPFASLGLAYNLTSHFALTADCLRMASCTFNIFDAPLGPLPHASINEYLAGIRFTF